MNRDGQKLIKGEGLIRVSRVEKSSEINKRACPAIKEASTVKPGVSKLFLLNNLVLVNILCFPKSHFQHKSPAR